MSLPGAVLALVRALPASPAVALARTVAILYLALRPDYRQETRRNLRIIMGKDSRWFWLKNGWRLGRNLALMAKVGRRSGDALVDRARICGKNLCGRTLERELHVAMASFHFGLWEYLPQVFSRSGYRVALAVGEQKDPALEKQLAGLRRGRGVTLAAGVKGAIKAGTENAITGFMLDNTSRGTQVWTECGGVRVRLPEIGFRLAARRGARLTPAFARFERGRLTVDVYPPGDERDAANALLEQVRRRPEEWVWWGKAEAVAA